MSNYFRTLLHLAGLLRLFFKSSEAFHIFHHQGLHAWFYCNATNHTNPLFFPPSPYQIIWDNCKEENTVALLFKTLPKAHGEVVQGEQRDYGSVTSDFSLLLLIASIVWKASCGKRSTHGYYTQTYYPWQKKWDEKREIIAKEPLPRGGITHSLQDGWFPSDWRRLRNSSRALVVRRSPVTSPPPVCVIECMVYCGLMTFIVCTCLCVFCSAYSRLCPFFSSWFLYVAIHSCLQWFRGHSLSWPLISLLNISLLSLFSLTNKFLCRLYYSVSDWSYYWVQSVIKM